MRKKKVIIRASFVQIPKIHAHSHISIFLRYEHSIGYPFGLVYEFDEPYLQLLVTSSLIFRSHSVLIHLNFFLMGTM